MIMIGCFFLASGTADLGQEAKQNDLFTIKILHIGIEKGFPTADIETDIENCSRICFVLQCWSKDSVFFCDGRTVEELLLQTTNLYQVSKYLLAGPYLRPRVVCTTKTYV